MKYSFEYKRLRKLEKSGGMQLCSMNNLRTRLHKKTKYKLPNIEH